MFSNNSITCKYISKSVTLNTFTRFPEKACYHISSNVRNFCLDINIVIIYNEKNFTITKAFKLFIIALNLRTKIVISSLNNS